MVTRIATLLALAAPLVAQAPGPVAQPTLTLAAALREAEQHAFANRIASGMAAADVARARLPLQGILPTARVDLSAIRTTDPIGAFGATLRQRGVTPAAFDPARLNSPAPITNVQSGLVLELPVFNADAWAGRRAALAAARAGSANSEWTSLGVKTDVVRGYYGAVLAAEQVQVLEGEQRAADAMVRQVQAMVAQGLVTKADALQAGVQAFDVSSQLLAARNAAVTAREQLALLLGRMDGTAPELPLALPPDSVVRTLAATDTLRQPAASVGARADVRAASAAADAARADRTRATGTLLPRVNSFARYDWFAPTSLFGGKPSWTVGVLASWSLFGGGRELAEVQGATARASVAVAAKEAATAQGRSELAIARRAVTLALQQLDLATRAAEQSREAQRLVEKRYAGGLATIAERLGAEAGATAKALAQSAARYAVIEAVAQHSRAAGNDPARLGLLESGR